MSKDKKQTLKFRKSNEEVYEGFQTLRNEQRIMAGKLSEMEAELNEHKIVIDTLKNIDSKRKCYRMIGGILVERTVQEVMPSLIINKEQLLKVIETLNEQLIKKGSEINDYKEKHDIHIKGQDSEQKQDKTEREKINTIVIDPIHA